MLPCFSSAKYRMRYWSNPGAWHQEGARQILICSVRRGHGRILICNHHTHTNLHCWGHHAVHHPGLHFGHRRGHHAVHHAGLHYVHHVPVIERLLLKGCMLRLSIKMSSRLKNVNKRKLTHPPTVQLIGHPLVGVESTIAPHSIHHSVAPHSIHLSVSHIL
jgi:hypothetical protein